MLTSHLDAYISRYGDFCANNDNDDTTDYFTLVHARGVITDSRSLLWSELVRLNLDTSYVLIIVYYTIVITCHVTDYDVHVPCVIYDMESY